MRSLWLQTRRLWLRSWWLRAAVWLVGGVVVLGVLSWIVIKWAPPKLASPQGLTGKAYAEEIGRVRTALLALLAGSLAAVGAVYAARTFALNRRGQLAERFTRAVDQVGSSHLDVRLGGIYALEGIARDAPEYHGPVVEVLTAYVREHAPVPSTIETPSNDATRLARRPWRSRRPPQTSMPPIEHDVEEALLETPQDVRKALRETPALRSRKRPKADIQAALSVLGRRTLAHDTGAPLELGRTVLTGVKLWAAHLEDAWLEQAHLDDALLADVHLDLKQAHGTERAGENRCFRSDW